MNTNRSLSPSAYISIVGKCVAAVLISYFAFLAGNAVSSVLVRSSSLGSHTPVVLSIIGPAFGGIAAGCTVAVLGLGAMGRLLAPLLAAIPILFSWYVRGAHAMKQVYVMHGGKLIKEGSSHPLYPSLFIMLFVTMAVSASLFFVVDRARHRDRR